jgi:hypothetical protein
MWYPRHGGVFETDTSLPLYGTDWASCEEIDKAAKERNWRWNVNVLRNNVCVAMVDLTGAKGFRGMIAPTFPTAFALAFCEAAEDA